MWPQDRLPIAGRRREWLDPAGVEREEGLEVSCHDGFHVARLGDLGHLIDVARVGVEAGVLGQLPPGAPEQRVVDEVEADERREEADVGQREPVAAQVAGAGEVSLQRVERAEQLVRRGIVRLLALCKPTPAIDNLISVAAVDNLKASGS